MVGRPDLPEFSLKCGKDCGTEIPPVLAVWFPVRESNFMALTVLKVKNAKPGRHVDGRGLCLVVKPSGSRTWVLRMQLNGQRRDYGMGSAYDVPLADARMAAAELRRRVRDGFDPVAERQKARRIIPASRPRHGLATKPWEMDGRAAIILAGYLVSNGMCFPASVESRSIRWTARVSSKCSHLSG